MVSGLKQRHLPPLSCHGSANPLLYPPVHSPQSSTQRFLHSKCHLYYPTIQKQGSNIQRKIIIKKINKKNLNYYPINILVRITDAKSLLLQKIKWSTKRQTPLKTSKTQIIVCRCTKQCAPLFSFSVNTLSNEKHIEFVRDLRC